MYIFDNVKKMEVLLDVVTKPKKMHLNVEKYLIGRVRKIANNDVMSVCLSVRMEVGSQRADFYEI